MKRITLASAYSEPKSIVLNRINMVNKLGSKDYYTEDVNALIKVEDEWWARPSRDYQGMRLYLLLSCFDALGQKPSGWDAIYSHLAEKLDVDPNTIKATKEATFPLDYTVVYQTLNDVYALKNSFYYFINHILAPDRKKELMDSIIVKKIGKFTNVIEDYDATETEKLKFLFDIRNCYNYKGTKHGYKDKQMAANSLSSEMNIEDNEHYHYSVQWNPDLLVKIIEEIVSKG